MENMRIRGDDKISPYIDFIAGFRINTNSQLFHIAANVGLVALAIFSLIHATHTFIVSIALGYIAKEILREEGKFPYISEKMNELWQKTVGFNSLPIFAQALALIGVFSVVRVLPLTLKTYLSAFGVGSYLGMSVQRS